MLAGTALATPGEEARVEDLRLITLDPGHFHAALFQKEMLPGMAEQAQIYAPLGPELLAHLNRIAQFNLRKEDPTRWKLEIHAGPNSLERMLSERCGNVVVLSGNNRGKIDRIGAIVRAGLHVLADKPWIIEAEDFPKLQTALECADQNHVVAFDGMTQRFEISCLLQRALVNDHAVFGTCLTGTDHEPAVYMESVHYLLKEVAGASTLRPAWFFDIRQQGEGLADVGTHLVDLVQWMLFPEQPIDYRSEIQVRSATRWPTPLTREQFQRVTGTSGFPDYPKEASGESQFDYFANNRVHYAIRGICVQLDVRWEFAPPAGGGDTELAIYCGSQSRVEVRQGKAEGFSPEVYVVPNRAEAKTEVVAALNRRVRALQATYPGLAVEDQGERLQLLIPHRYRVGHEAHFGLLARQFLGYVRNPRTQPAWEKPNMLAKYFVTTMGIALARQTPRPVVSVREGISSETDPAGHRQ